MRNKLLTLIFTICFVLGGWYLYDSRYQIGDWWRLRDYSPSPEIQDLSNLAGFSGYGERLFFVHYPELHDKTGFNEFCELPDTGLVLGCYDGLNIYILDVDEAKLEQVEQVTAAHEMLHAAYDRLTTAERQRIDELLASTYSSLQNERIVEVVEQYRERSPDIVSNELHSIIGTEVQNIGAELEEYYSQYFLDRSKIVATSQDYEKVFVTLENQIGKIEKQLLSLRQQINKLEADLATKKSTLNQKRAELNKLEASQQFDEYNAKVGPYNTLVVDFNNSVAKLQNLIQQYNRLTEKYKDIAFEHNELINSLDSSFEPIQ